MYIRRLLQIHVVTIATLGTLALGLGQRDATLPLVMLAMAVTALWVTDILNVFRVGWAVTNLVVGGVLLFVLLWHLTHLRGTALVLEIANLLAYLEMVLLFQEKDARTCWLILLLSLLQVIVAAVLNQGYWFGLLLVTYLVAAISTLVLLCLYEEYGGVRAANPSTPLDAAEVPHGAAAASGFENVVAGRPVGPARAARLLQITLRLGTQVIGLAAVLFIVVPRAAIAPWRGVLLYPVRAVGYSGTVRLGELGTAIENPQEVCRVKFTRFDNGEPYWITGSIYLRGDVLLQYGNGSWHRPPLELAGSLKTHAPEELGRFGELVRQQVLMEPLDRQELFCVWPFVSLLADQGLMVDRAGRLLLRPATVKEHRFSFELVTPAFRNGTQRQLVPVWQVPNLAAALDLPDGRSGKQLPGLVATAESWLEQVGLERSNPYGIVRFLEYQFRSSGQFRYSLDPQPRPWDVDPIEDFVTLNRCGHCEYFATALALMLRSQGIPARVVLGFRTEEWNPLGQFFQVRQLHAHTWVEAFLWRNQVPEELVDDDPLWHHACGGWLRLDPTPAAEPEASDRLWTAAWRCLNWLDFAWVNYVVEMDQARQQRAVYQPLATPVLETVRNLLRPQWWRNAWTALCSSLGRAWQAFRSGRWFNWQGGLVAVIGMLLLALMVWALSLLLGRVIRAIGQKGAALSGQKVRVAFYRRLEAALARRGLRRSPCQTQRQFASVAGVQLAGSAGMPQLAELPITVTEAYYQVRFGGRELDSRQAQAVEQAVGQIESLTGTPPTLRGLPMSSQPGAEVAQKE